ncbi:heterocycloanthracin/sonorensin family bacteriocin [Lentibacillus daqui]|uniref:heterocycloanthracin/sonorensin family bacteriocin n=1 Tax=Lentibacillus daqui TaxID=2911514 RepID=UPI0022B139CD|nr:heterocycloanthracin/sonorensin family bacteriocin [Lentibacillus daqui]
MKTYVKDLFKHHEIGSYISNNHLKGSYCVKERKSFHMQKTAIDSLVANLPIINKYKGEVHMQYYQNDLQQLGMDNYHVSELVPMDHMNQNQVQVDSRLCGGCGRCGGCFRCGGFRCGGCFGCFGCFGFFI